MDDPPPVVLDPGLTQAQLAQIEAQYAGHAEYGRQWGLAAVNAAHAYARLEARYGDDVVPGEGVTVAVMDSGIDQDSWGFESTRITETLLRGAEEEDFSDADPRDFSHGTAVAGIIAGLRDGPVPRAAMSASVHGLAWGAKIDAYAAPLGSGGSTYYTPVSIMGLARDDAYWDYAFTLALRSNPHVLNLSFGYEGLIDQYDAEDIRRSFGRAIAALAQSDRTTDKTIITVAAGNAEKDRCLDFSAPWCDIVRGGVDASVPELLPGLPVHIAELRSHYVAVVATDEAGNIAVFSNRCGIAAKWCIAAPGERVAVLYHGPDNSDTVSDEGRGYGMSRGTSFAAPHVAGGIALLAHLFRNQLANTELLDRLYATAAVTPDPVSAGGRCPEHLDTDGDFNSCELSSTYGRGIMDLAAATAPVGTLSFNRAPVETSRLHTGAAMGDALASLADRKVALFDTLNAPFWTRLGNFTSPVATGELERRVAYVSTGRRPSQAAFGPASRPGLALEWMDMRVSHLSLATGGMRLSHAGEALAVSVFTTSEGSYPVQGVTLAWHPSEVLRFGTGWLQERRSLLHSTAGGAFGDLSAATTFTSVGATFKAGAWEVTADAELGTVAPSTSGVLRLSTLWTSAYSLSAHKGGLRFSLAQPLRVEHGVADLHLPDGRTREGAIVYRDLSTSLAPSGRQLDLSVSWDRPLTIGAMHLGATFSRHPHHTRAGMDYTLLAGYRLQF